MGSEFPFCSHSTLTALTEFFTRPADLQVGSTFFKSTEYELVCVSGISAVCIINGVRLRTTSAAAALRINFFLLPL